MAAQTLLKVQGALILGTTIYIPNGNEVYVPANIRQASGLNGPYKVQLLESSSIAPKGAVIQIDNQGLLWGLERVAV